MKGTASVSSKPKLDSVPRLHSAVLPFKPHQACGWRHVLLVHAAAQDGLFSPGAPRLAHYHKVPYFPATYSTSDPLWSSVQLILSLRRSQIKSKRDCALPIVADWRIAPSSLLQLPFPFLNLCLIFCSWFSICIKVIETSWRFTLSPCPLYLIHLPHCHFNHQTLY